MLDSVAVKRAPLATGGLIYLKPPQSIDPTGPVIGIDLGTTNSCCAVLSNGKPLILRSKDGYNTIPSVVALSQNNKLLVGHRAKAQMLLHPSRSIYGAKRLVGRDFDSATVRQVKERFHYQIVPGPDGRAAVILGENVLALEEVQAIVLQECREMAEQHLNQKVSRAVVTCPAYYSEPQREAVRRAGAMAGMKVERILNEPTAAALAYGMNRQLAKTVLVYDLGGGTFDATLMSIEGNVFEVMATGGDIFLGGVDFDGQVVDVLLRKYAETHAVAFGGDAIALSRVNDVAERAKVALSERNAFDVHLPMLEMDPSGGAPKDLKCTLTRAELEEACKDLVERTISTVQDVLLDAKVKPSDVDDIVLAGGMSRMPLVRKKLETLFRKTPHASVNADEAVALGAALYSGTVDKVSSVVLIDVVPMTIGVGMPGGTFKRIIERNTPLPVSKSFGVSTQADNQDKLELMIFQGEDGHVSANEFLGAVEVEGLPRGPKGAVQVAVTLQLDSECVLTVEARELRTRKAFKSKLATRFTSEEIAKRLGIDAAGKRKAEEKRGEELQKRAGGFWGKLKQVFGR
jgi:molecular chaperone DnaK (HSP70)